MEEEHSNQRQKAVQMLYSFWATAESSEVELVRMSGWSVEPETRAKKIVQMIWFVVYGKSKEPGMT